MWAVTCSLVSICAGFGACTPEEKNKDPDAGGGASGGHPANLGGEGGSLGGEGGAKTEDETAAGGLGGTPGGDGDGDELGDPEDLHFEFERVSVSSDEVQGNAELRRLRLLWLVEEVKRQLR